jgi:quercetin dioxygenase-like cupin family protein
VTLNPYVRSADEHQKIRWIGGSTLSVVLDSAATGGQLMVVRSDARLGDAAPVHVHDREDESFLVLSGSMLVWVGDDRYEVSEGGICMLPRKIPHAYRVTSQTATFLNLSTPAGLEQAFREAGWSQGGDPPADWAITPQGIAAAVAKVGCTVLGPPPAADALTIAGGL